MRMKQVKQQHPAFLSLFRDFIQVVLSVILPPAGVAMQEGVGRAFWINIVLTLLGYVPGVVHAAYIIGLRDAPRSTVRGREKRDFRPSGNIHHGV